MKFRKRWEELWAPERASPDAVYTSYVRWSSRYSEAHRRYHVKQHIANCLTLFDEVRRVVPIRNPRVVEAALWWHDMVYITTGRVDNEQLSAEAAKVDMQLLGCLFAFRRSVERGIIATKHSKLLIDHDEQLIADIDLHSLGLSPERFRMDGAAIREEYGHLPDDVFAARWRETFSKFLKKKQIYYTPLFVERYERQARANLEMAVMELK